MLLICSTLVTKSNKNFVQIISGNYFHQHNDEDGDGNKTCGDGVRIGITRMSMGWE